MLCNFRLDVSIFKTQTDVTINEYKGLLFIPTILP